MTLVCTALPLHAGACCAVTESPIDHNTEYGKWRDLTLYIAAYKAVVKMNWMLIVALAYGAAMLILWLAPTFGIMAAWILASGALLLSCSRSRCCRCTLAHHVHQDVLEGHAMLCPCMRA